MGNQLPLIAPDSASEGHEHILSYLHPFPSTAALMLLIVEKEQRDNGDGCV